MTYAFVLDALGDPTRRQIVERLAQAPRSVTALSAGLPVSRPAVSQHLKLLKEAGLVSVQVVGARRIYRLEQQGFAALRAWLDRLREDAVAAYHAEVQRQLDERRHT